MLWLLILVLVILWLAGFTLTHIGGLLYLLLVVAVVILVLQLISGRRPW